MKCNFAIFSSVGGKHGKSNGQPEASKHNNYVAALDELVITVLLENTVVTPGIGKRQMTLLVRHSF